MFRARDRALHVSVALKVLRLGGNPTAVRRFHHEVNLARKVKHENVCAIYEYGEDQGIVYCTMELVGGTNLREMLRAGAPLPLDHAYEIALKAAAGLQAIHDAGVLHRDLKANNIMIDARERSAWWTSASPGRCRRPARTGHPWTRRHRRSPSATP